MGPILKNVFIIFALFLLTIMTAKSEENYIDDDDNNVDTQYTSEPSYYENSEINRAPAIVDEKEQKMIEPDTSNIEFIEDETYANQQYFNDDNGNTEVSEDP